MKSPERIAIVRLTSLGDIIFCMASLQLIRRRFPHARITWFADSRFADILDHNPDLDSVVKLNLKGLKSRFSWDAATAEYRKLTGAGRFDLAIDLHGMLKSAAVAASVSRRRAGFHWSVAKEPLTTLFYGNTFRIGPEYRAVGRFARLAAAALGFTFAEEELVSPEPYLFHSESDAVAVDPWFSREKKNVVLVPGTSVGYKNYPKEKYLKVAQGLDAQLLICHGSDPELQVATYLAEECASVQVLPRLNLNQLKAVMRRADLVVGGDTGPTHMAWACGVPSITLYGATPDHCVYPGPTCRSLTSGPRPYDKKPDHNDFSIQQIQESEIIRLAHELLQS